MINIIKKYVKLFLTISCITLAIDSNVYAACCGDVQRGEGDHQCPGNCTWQRSDNRCNDDSECCPGSYCSAFGYCENCRFN